MCAAGLISYAGNSGGQGSSISTQQMPFPCCLTLAAGLPRRRPSHCNRHNRQDRQTPTHDCCGAAGLISYAGNWVGQGSSLGAVFTGRSLFDYGAFPSSAAAWASWPATYMAASSYQYYGGGETIIRTLQPTGEVQGQAPASGALPDTASMSCGRAVAELWLVTCLASSSY